MNTSTQTIRTLRLAAGLSCQQVAERASAILGRDVSDRAAVQWEWRGVRSGELEEALAQVFGVTVSDIREASKEARVSPGPRLYRGGRKKNHTECFSS